MDIPKKTSEEAKAFNILLEKGEKLEKLGELVKAQRIYDGLIAADPYCKACQAHLGAVKAKLRKAGYFDNNSEEKQVPDEHDKENFRPK